MSNYDTSKIRNICLLAHGGSGKTSLCETMLYNTGALDRLGKVADGNTTSDFDPEEIKRKISISMSVVPCEWKNTKINVIDTPGYFDFVGEIKQAIRVAEGSVILVCAKDGVAVGTKKSWLFAKSHKLPVMFFVNKMDEENANFSKVVDQLTELYGRKIVPFTVPIFEGEKFIGFADIINMKAYKFDKINLTNKVNCEAREDLLVGIDIPQNLKSKIEKYRNVLFETIAETNESLMNKFFEGTPFTDEDIEMGLSLGISSSDIVPVFCGSAINNLGVQNLMDAINKYMPSPAANPIVKCKKLSTGEDIEIKASENSPTTALVFKTIADPFVGKISIFRVYSGTIKPDSVLFNSTTEKPERISQIFMLRGKKQIPTDRLVSGDIGAIAKLQHTNTNDTLCNQSNQVVLPKIEFPDPSLSLSVEPKAKGDEEKISSGLHKLQDEDLTFKVSINTETRQTIISGVGEQHLDIIVSKLKNKFGVSVNLAEPKIAYRETIKKKVKVEGKHKKQSGGHGQYGHVWIEFEPGEKEELTFEEKIFGGAVPRQYIPAVEKGLNESIQKGVLAGYPVVNLKATLVDGSYHAVDSSEMAFKIATHVAYKKGLSDASPALLEPICHVEVFVPEENMGDIIGDLNKRRGRILGMSSKDEGVQEILAEVPEAEMYKYATDLRSMTQGLGYFKMDFERYEEAPPMISQKVMGESKKHMVEEEEYQ